MCMYLCTRRHAHIYSWKLGPGLALLDKVCPILELLGLSRGAQKLTWDNLKGFIQLGFTVSNWQKVQKNTDLFSDMQRYLYTEEWLD